MRLPAFIALGMLIITGCASTPAETDTDTEHLRAEQPEGWLDGTHTLTSKLRMAEFIHPQMRADGWGEKIQFERIEAQPVAPAADFIGHMREDLEGSCPEGRLYNTWSGKENGYPTEVALMVCPKNAITQLGQITMLKVIQGNEALYTITRAKRLDAFDTSADANEMPKEDIANWSAYLSAISVCDPTRAEAHPCN